MMVLDVYGLDLKILEMLREDGRIPFTGIGKRLKLSKSTIRKRVMSLGRGKNS